MALKLEIGKTYATRTGKNTASIVEQHPITGLFGGYLDGSRGHYYAWRENGTSSTGYTGLDLITSMPVQPSDKPNAIPHADMIRAVLDGKVVQWRAVGKYAGQWQDYDSELLDMVAALTIDLQKSRGDYEFRIKPEPVTKEQALEALEKVLRAEYGATVDTLRRFIEEQP